LKVFKPDSNGKKKSIDEWNKRIDEVEELIKKEEERKSRAPFERYQIWKKNWSSHESSWSRHGLNRYDGHGCNQFTGCIPECRYYPEEGRIDDEELTSRNG
jgi:hypothetical protein